MGKVGQLSLIISVLDMFFITKNQHWAHH